MASGFGNIAPRLARFLVEEVTAETAQTALTSLMGGFRSFRNGVLE
jgi:hypothetical protein